MFLRIFLDGNLQTFMRRPALLIFLKDIDKPSFQQAVWPKRAAIALLNWKELSTVGGQEMGVAVELYWRR